MGNRSYLYITNASGESCEQIAEANNNFPVLWQILLAGGDPAAAIDHQRVFGDNQTDNLAVDAKAAFERVKHLAACMREHPLLHKLPALEQQFEGLEMHLAGLIDENQDGEEGAPLFSANLDELSWLEDVSSEEFIRKTRAECDERWAQVRTAIDGRDFPALDEALGVNEYGASFGDWNNWAWGFGFSGISHPYFDMQDEPRAESFADFVPEVDEDEGLPWGYRRVREGGKVGLERSAEDGDNWQRLLEPVWDQINEATRELVWIKRDGLFGLARVSGEVGEILLTPQLEFGDSFAADGEDGPRCSIVRKDGKEGILLENGKWLFEPTVDEIWRFENGYAPFRQDGHEGYIDADGRIAIPAIYDWAGCFGTANVGQVERGGKNGLVRSNGDIAVPLEYEGVEWMPEMDAFRLTQGGKNGLWRADGSPWLACEWDEFSVLVRDRLLAVKRGKKWGVLDWQGKERLPVEFQTIELVDEDGEEENCWLEVKRNGRVGLCDEHGQVLVPTDYQKLENFEPLPEEAGEIPAVDTLVRVVRKAKGQSPKYGAFDRATQREIVPCDYDVLALVAMGNGEWGFIAACDNPRADRERLGKRRHGILRSDGSLLIPLEYAWLQEAYELEGWQISIVVRKLLRHWQDDLPIKAVHGERGCFVWLGKDGRCEEHVDHLERCYAEGDLESALALGRIYRDGGVVEAAPRLARTWLARAAGLPESLAANPDQLVLPPGMAERQASGGVLGGLLRRLTGKPPVAEPPPVEVPKGLYRALFELVMMLVNGQGGPASPGAARYWLELAVQMGGGEDSDVNFRMGYFLCEGIGGDADIPRGIEFYERAGEQNESVAYHNLGVLYEDGQGVRADLARAMDYFRRSEKMGYIDAAYAIGRILWETSGGLPAEARRKQLGEAAYYLNKSANSDDSRYVAESSGYLGLVTMDEGFADYSLPAAEKHLLRGANMDSTWCMEILIDELYANPDSPLKDGEKAAEWRGYMKEVRRSGG
jgi:TPR repeat protein